MFRKLTPRFSPASPIALLALFVALSGVSYAAGTIGTADLQNGAVTKKKLRKNAVATGKIVNGAVKAPKIADGAVGTPKLADAAVTTHKLADGAVNGAKVDEASLGIVPDAAKLAGKEPGAYESKGFGGVGDTETVSLPTDATTQVQSLSLPAGVYMVFARGGLNHNGGAPTGAGQTCTVAAGKTSQTITFGALAANLDPGDREQFDMTVLAGLEAPGEATLTCTTSGAWGGGNVTDPSIAAISLQP